MTKYEAMQDGPWRLDQTLEDGDYNSILEYVKEQEGASLRKIAELLNVAPIVVQRRYEEEARRYEEEAQYGPTSRELAEDLLVRRLLDVEGGWPADPSWEHMGAVRDQVIAWSTLMQGTKFDEAQSDIVACLLRSALPAGWLPAGNRDPVISAAFDEFWKAR